ncbi:hypothetical protein VP01_1479g2 [Puccinia sorghi]|uniref:Uncharacterized protein n=1 Tax=Puccinia sorghi TaxID=27349 RepID=A0A0L6VJL6_9BASI|nr:hypothetical protein VP01_1479g2 [Puccinia sorghi]
MTVNLLIAGFKVTGYVGLFLCRTTQSGNLVTQIASGEEALIMVCLRAASGEGGSPRVSRSGVTANVGRMVNPNASQLTRKTNDSQARKLQTYHQDLIPPTTPNQPFESPTKKRSVSALKHDLLPQPPHNPPSKKHKPASPSSHNPLHTTPWKLVRKNPISPIHRNPIHLNLSHFNLLKPSEKKKEKTPKVDIREQFPLKSHLPALGLNPSNGEGHPKCKPLPLAQPPRLMVPPKASKPIHTYQITSPLKKICVPKPEEAARRTFNAKQVGLEMIRASKPPGPARLMRPIVACHSLPSVSAPKAISPMVSPSKKRNRIEGELLSRARRLIEINQSSLRMWQSDLEAGALREVKTRKFQVLNVLKDKGCQVAHCLEIDPTAPPCHDIPPPEDPSRSATWRIFLRGPDCNPNIRLKIFSPWSQLDPNMIICDKFISF